MLGTLLERVGALLPKSFTISNLFPMLMFAAVNGLMIYWMSDWFREVVHNYLSQSAGKQALIGFPILIVIALAAYILSTLNLLQRELLEGKYLWDPARRKLTAAQQKRIEALHEDIDATIKNRFALHALNADQRLLDARDEGNKLETGCQYSASSEAARAIKALHEKTLGYEAISAADLETEIRLLEGEFRKCKVDKEDANDSEMQAMVLLDRQQTILLARVDFALKEAEAAYVALYNKREFNYSRYRVAPTAMGNIAESVRSYARSRYAMDLDAFWSRLQKVVVGDDKFYSSLVDTKTQLDFTISLFWLTVCFTVIWTVELLILRKSILAFVLVAVGGPVLSILWYQIALQNYRAFADVLKTSIDLYRFDLLALLRVERPRGNEHERTIWGGLNSVLGYGEPGELRYYDSPKKS
ncbi:MAG TPA: hypothetical protein VJM12_15645 [Pyrinomonadaceae bacterium]|nr:hypothetical protein [Pyrinomonadaceae bacterium]